MLIRRGRQEGWLTLPITALKPWADLNGLAFNNVSVGPLPGLEHRGSAVVAERDLLGDNNDPLMAIPRDLVLSLEGVRLHAKSDKHLRQLLEVLGDFGMTARISILVFLLYQSSISRPDNKIGVKNPMTEYVKFLPQELLPTFWTEEERTLLIGTTLKPAVEAKLKSLNKEYEKLHKLTESIAWCNDDWWYDDTYGLTFDDWLQVDAMYRSRALEFPGIGDSMVPGIDMANHASGDETAALYEVDSKGNAVLLLREGKTVNEGEEVTITYGDKKGACEMLFSYGFIEDSMNSATELFLDLEIPQDDPLKVAKMHINKAAPGFKIFDSEEPNVSSEGTGWMSDFIWLVIVNEEDGLEFQILQTNDGGRELQVFWKEEKLEEPHKLKELLEANLLWPVFQLRAVALIQDRVESQLRVLHSSENDVRGVDKDGELVRQGVWNLAMRFRDLERDLLERSYGDLEEEKEKLLATETVQRYLALQEEEDFS
ncbi:uncharacterized protein J3D65DRAFT_642437 [Phyllosticta citribraziliensis]|uniref:SET domain-containing protein n=1 Tax=Phyllosticta citribraziliensis TaxID=989973 RepID=A0ABR1L2V6_9PEZI